MATHLSLRLAWHDEGWNGHVCKNPEKNIYCVGQHSYPGTMIKEQRDLKWEKKVAGKHCAFLENKVPACGLSINAFGTEEREFQIPSPPPDFYRDDSEPAMLPIKPATAYVWPYEGMYSEDVNKTDDSKQTYDYKKRLENAKKHFSALTPKETLVFYYVNKSNPYSEEESKNFIIVGISRLKKIGDVHFYNNVSENNKKRYAGGFVWQRMVQSNYPNEGFVLPFHKYRDNDEVMERLMYKPELSYNFKYGTRHITDDDSLIYIEHFLKIVEYLIEIKDDTHNWIEQKKWLEGIIAELWASRGAYPGLAPIFDCCKMPDLIKYFKNETKNGNELNAKTEIFNYLNKKSDKISNCDIPADVLEEYRDIWLLDYSTEKRELLESVISRIALRKKQVKYILDDKRDKNGILSSLKDICDNPYLLHEEYIGNDEGDEITFNKIDHSMMPSPNLGLDHLVKSRSWKRFRALLVSILKSETVHSFIEKQTLLKTIENRNKFFDEWRKQDFNENYFQRYKEKLESKIVSRSKNNSDYLYLKSVFNNERLIEENIRNLVNRDPIQIQRPINDERWRNYLYKADSELAKSAEQEYSNIIDNQLKNTKKTFNSPIAIISGSAGTGKTTVVESLIKAIKHTSNETENICLLAPTGKAADRLFSKAKMQAETIHRFLAKNKWLNFNNFSYRKNGNKEDKYSTYIIDEVSMIDLDLLATFFSAVDWHSVKRLILVGDPNQLPPIGRGKAFSEIIDFVKKTSPEAYAKLTDNVRQLENKVNDQGTGILDLSSLFISENITSDDATKTKYNAVDVIKKIQEDGVLDKDIDVKIWKDDKQLIETIYQIIEKSSSEHTDFSKVQIITPYRSELFGTENINLKIQEHFNKYNLDKKGNLGGITYFDRIIQYRNRAGNNAYNAYDMSTKRLDKKYAVYNGEMGEVIPHAFDKKWKYNRFRLRKFQAVFDKNKNKRIEYKSERSVTDNIELAYAISIHKSQGSEFDHVIMVLPKHKQALVSTELLYTGITRAQKHLTILIEEDFTPLLSLRRPERSKLSAINSSLFDFNPIPDELLRMKTWYEEGKVNSTLTEYMVRSKSEVIIANMLHHHDIDFKYEQPLKALDGSFYLPDFTIKWEGKTYYWEHLGMMNLPEYKEHWEKKKAWYDEHFPGRLITTVESPQLSIDAESIINKYFKNKSTNE